MEIFIKLLSETYFQHKIFTFIKGCGKTTQENYGFLHNTFDSPVAKEQCILL